MIKYFFYLLTCSIFIANFSQAQRINNLKQTKDGTISGNVLDSITKKPLQSATIFVYNESVDTAATGVKEMLAGSAVSKHDGSFEISNIPAPGKIRVQISTVGYEVFNKIVSVSNNNIIDIGNAMLEPSSGSLKTVNVIASQPYFQMGVDRKVFNVSQSLVSTGQTAQEVLAQIPSVSVDIDGNVSLRGASPQIYIDGMPTILTIDQIPSDIIDKVELITNPSAKYDASTGGSGIINIVLKKNSNKGYNGGITIGDDTRNSWNIAGDINMRLGKFNVFARGAHRERNSQITNHLRRDAYRDGLPTDSSLYQQGLAERKGAFTFFNLGTDYNINKRNIFTVSGRYVHGVFKNGQQQTVDSLYQNNPYVFGNLLSNSRFQFTDYQGELKYKHNFSEKGDHNILFDVNYNRAKADNNSAVSTANYAQAGFDPSFIKSNQWRNTVGNGGNKNWVFQADYINPLTKDTKIEAGVRGQIRKTNSYSEQYLYNSLTKIPSDLNIYQPDYLDTLASSKYAYTDQVYAAYGIFSSKIGDKLSYQLGARVESSNYHGIYDSIPSLHPAPEFKVKYPLELFPSAFLTYAISDGQDVQINYTRKINRPNFFQLLPIYDYSDPYNIRVGNPNLNPEFTSMYELSYDKSYKNSGSFLATAYYRNASNLITMYQYQILTPSGDTAIANSYMNAKSSHTYGLELTNKVTVAKIWDVMLNANLYNSIINNGSALGNAQNQRWSWFGKWNNTVKLPANITFQVSAEYHSKAVLPSNGPSQSSGGGPGIGGGGLGTSQGYIASNLDVDAALKKDWKWGKGNTLSLTASISDIFGTDKNESYSVTPFMRQDNYRLRQPRIVRFTLSYRFGRFDKNIFKKGQPQNNSDSDMSGGMDMGG